MNLLEVISYLLKFRKPTIENEVYTIENPWILFKKVGKIKLTDGQTFSFNPKNKENILKLVFFALSTGIHFGHERYQWKFNEKKGYVETPQGIKFKLKGLGLIFDETFLKQIHFAGFDLKNGCLIRNLSNIVDILTDLTLIVLPLSV